MRTADQCLAKAREMDQRAAANTGDGPEWRAMADHWRNLANEALWQEMSGIQPTPGPAP
ncbi:hypothetical protein [Brevundimonas sp. NIBR10]|uniref:hypothetical protein n=1 Tax=Brevundimonas sp. NIBR10 TaxID=3015997 RepID=UPI0022F15FAD|nr:hypothetical protein [Brevundimonas sp. NIBR10]